MKTGRPRGLMTGRPCPHPSRKKPSDEGFRSVVGAPIMVEGGLWGLIVVFADEILRDDTETRLTDFTHLVASSIAIVDARNNLIASRARIVTASDETRRRIERNLHADGIQQRLVALGLDLLAVATRSASPSEAREGLSRRKHAASGPARRDPGLLPGTASRAARALRPRPVPARAGPPVADPGQRHCPDRAEVPRTGRDCRLLCRLRGARECREALAGRTGLGDGRLGRYESARRHLRRRRWRSGPRPQLRADRPGRPGSRPWAEGSRWRARSAGARSISAQLPLGVQAAQERPVL